MLFAIRQADYDKIKDSEHMTVIGHFTEKGGSLNIVQRDGSLIPMEAQGWNHFEQN